MLTLLVWLLLLGVVAGGIRAIPETYCPQPFKVAIYCVLLIILILLIANAFGIGPNLRLR